MLLPFYLGRKTLHGHWLLWIKEYMQLRQMLFHQNEAKQMEARQRLKKYIESVMNSTYGDLPVFHNCDENAVLTEEITPMDEDEDEVLVMANSNVATNNIPTRNLVLESTTKRANDLFYDYDSDSSNVGEQLQQIRNTRNKNKKDNIGGKILHCRECSEVRCQNFGKVLRW